MRVRISSRSVTKVMYMYHIHIWKNEQLPVPVPGVAVLIVHLDPWHDLCHTCNPQIWTPIEKLAYKHVSYAYLKKNELLPVLVPEVAVLVVPLDPRYGLCRSWNLWIWIPLEKVAYKHVHSSSNPKIKIFSNLLLRILGFSMRRCSCTLEINLSASKTSKFGFCLKNWPINMCIVPGCLSSADLEGGCKNAPPLP